MEVKKINIACEDVIKYNDLGEIELCKPNLSNYPIYSIGNSNLYDEYIKYNPLVVFFKNCENKFNLKTLKELTEKKEKFIYPIFLYDHRILEIENIDLPEELINSLRSKNSKIAFIEHVEGIVHAEYNFKWLSDLSKKYTLRKESIVLISSNIKIKDRFSELLSNGIIEDNFSVYPYNYFSCDFWFTDPQGDLFCDGFKSFLSTQLPINLENKKRTKIERHFLCFNRVPRNHRVCIFGELMTNPNLINKSITTLGSINLVNNRATNFTYAIEDLLENRYINKKTLINFFENYNAVNDCKFDNDLNINQAGVFNSEAHSKTFLNIITETAHNPNYIFFSEKTFKPIYACQPFIMLGGPFYLKTLKEYGYKTFDKWWDESYDNEVNFTARFEKIIKLLEEIATWDIDKCQRIANEMEDVLIHNFNIMINNKEPVNLYNYLIDNPHNLS